MLEEDEEHTREWLCFSCSQRKSPEEMEVIIMAKRSKKAEISLEQSTPVESNLTREERIAIAQDAANRGFKVVAAERGLDWKVLRAWVMSYCRKKAKAPAPVQEPAVIKADTCYSLPPFPPFDIGWPHQVQVCWLNAYVQLRGKV